MAHYNTYPEEDIFSQSGTEGDIFAQSSGYDIFNDGGGFYGPSAGETALPMYESMQLEGWEALNEIAGFDTSNIRDKQAKTAEQIEKFQPEFGTLFTTDDLGGWWTEQATLNSLNTIVPMAGHALAEILKKTPYLPARAVGHVLSVGTYLTSYNANLGDTLMEHKDRAGGRELTTQEKVWAGVIAAGVTMMDAIVPKGVGKGIGKDISKYIGRGKAKLLRDDIISKMSVAEQGLAKSLSVGGKYVAAKAGQELLTEGGQKVLQIGSSQDPMHMFTPEGAEAIASEALVAGPIAGGMATPSGIAQGSSHNRAINRARSMAQRFNKEMLNADITIQRETGIDPKKFKTHSIQDIPDRVGLSGTIESIYNKTPVGKAIETIGTAGLFKAPMSIKKLRDEAGNAKDYNLLNDILQMFLPVGTISGEQQHDINFDTLKSVLHGELLAKTTAVLNKYSNKSVGSLGVPVMDDEVSNAIKTVMEDRTLLDNNPFEDIISTEDLKTIAESLDTSRKILHKATGIKGIENYIPKPISQGSVKKNRSFFEASLLESSRVLYEYDKARLGAKFDPDNYIWHEDEVTRNTNVKAISEEIVKGRDPDVVTSRWLQKQWKKDKTGKGRESFEKSRSKEWSGFEDENGEHRGGIDDSFREQDAGVILEGYLSKAATRAASAITFGSNNADKLHGKMKELKERGVLKQEDVDRIWGLYDAAHNIYRRDVGENEQRLRDTSRVATHVAAITHLGLATISSLSELSWVGERSGFGNMMLSIPKAFEYTKGIKKGLNGKVMQESEGWRTLANLGLNLNPKTNERLDSMFSIDKSDIMNAYFRSPFGSYLTQWTNFNRNWAAQAGMMNMNRRAKGLLNGSIVAMDEKRLANELKENGLTMQDFQKMAELSKDKDGNININIIDEKYLEKKFINSKGNEIRVRDTLVPWIHKIVDDVVVHPKAHNKPLWMSDPSFAMIAQLKTFPIVFGNTVVKRLLRKLNPRNCNADFGTAVSAVAGMAVAYALAYTGEQIKSAIRQQDPRDLGWVDIGNMTGLTGGLGLVLGGARYGDLTTSLLGVSWDAVNKLMTEAINPFTEGEFVDGAVNLVDWTASSFDSALGPVGIYFKPAGDLFGDE